MATIFSQVKVSRTQGYNYNLKQLMERDDMAGLALFRTALFMQALLTIAEGLAGMAAELAKGRRPR
jgi:hypothetical protein